MLNLALSRDKQRVHLSPQLRKQIAEWLVDIIEEKGNLERFFKQSSEPTEGYFNPPTTNPESGAWVAMSWNIQLTDDGEETQLLRALRLLMNAIEIELCEASKKSLYSAYEEYALPNTEHFDV